MNGKWLNRDFTALTILLARVFTRVLTKLSAKLSAKLPAKLPARLPARVLAITILTAGSSIANGADTTESYQLPDDPLDSVMWENMAQRFFPGEVVFDQRVVINAPHDACLLYTSPSPRD